jgi:hypothetical protein
MVDSTNTTAFELLKEELENDDVNEHKIINFEL